MGSGKSGLYCGTYAPVKRPKDVIFDTRKIEGYLLNEAHPIGGSKARFMHAVLGYSQSDAKLFHEAVVSSILNEAPTKTEDTPYGTKYTFHVKLSGKVGNLVSANVVVVIQRDNGRSDYKIVTVYPDKRG